MKISIVTPYSGENRATLDRCLESVAQQTLEAKHLMVGDGRAIRLPASIEHIRLPHAHRDYGDTPRLIGTLSAFQQGCDAVMWLDADCWLDPHHVEQMVELAEREVVSVVTATRNLMRPDGTLLDRCRESDGEAFTDTNCYLVMRDAIPTIAPLWGFKPARDAVVGDRFVWETAKTFRRAHNGNPTVFYTTQIADHYLERGEEPPSGARTIRRNPLTGFYESHLFKLIESTES